MENIQDSVSEYTKDSAQKIDTHALYHEQMLKAL